MKKRTAQQFIPTFSSLLIGFAIICLFSQSFSKQSAMKPFSNFSWKNRILVVFVDDFDKEYYKKQIQLLKADAIDLKERDLIVFGVSKTEVNCEYGPNSPKIDAKEVRGYYQINDGVTRTILIGKDSGEKQRWSEVVETDKIFGLIDGMPMRQSEMRKNKK